MSSKIKVLMVDDEDRFRETTEKILRKKGFETVMAATGEEALTKLSEHPDVVVLDVKMPGMDGHQVLREIKAKKPDMPVIMLTGHGRKPSATVALEEGAFDYLAKPCDVDVLAAKIDEAYHFSQVDKPEEERQVRDIMIAISDYTTVREDDAIADAIVKLRDSFSVAAHTSRLMEIGHRSIIVFDGKENMKGILAIRDLLKALMPRYLFAPKPSMADTIQFSPMFWSGAYYRETRQLSKSRVKDIMSPATTVIREDANLMEAAYLMVQNQIMRIPVVDKNNKVVGVVREWDLFFEMERAIRLAKE